MEICLSLETSDYGFDGDSLGFRFSRTQSTESPKMSQSEEAEILSSSSKENDSFPIGMRVLAVDDDVVCLKVLESLLLKCGYKVTTAQHAFAALKLLRENKDYYDLVISDVKMPDMDGFKLLEIVVFEMDLPVIMLSVDSEVDTVMKGIKHGACDYLVKPVRLEELKIIWKHVARKLRTKVVDDPSVRHDQVTKSEEDPSSKLTRKCKNPRKERDDEVNNSSEDDVSTQKRPRVAWSKELHEKFVDAVKYLGVDRAVPKKILDHMGVSGLTRENVASHLQKYRKALKKNSAEVSQQYQGDVGSSGFGVNPPSSVILSFNGQRLNHNSIEGFRVDGYQNHCNTIPVSHGQGYHIGNTHVAAPWFNHHNILRSQYAPTTQAIQLRNLSFGYTSDSLTGGPLAQSTCKQLSYLPITSRANQRDEYTGYPSQSSWARGTGPGSCSLTQPEYALNQQDIDNLLENTNSKQGVVSGLDMILPSQHDKQQYSAVGAELDLGAQINRDTLDIQRGEHEGFNGISSSELSPHPLEPSSSETNFHLSKCDSADDLHSVLKQFQQ